MTEIDINKDRLEYEINQGSLTPEIYEETETLEYEQRQYSNCKWSTNLPMVTEESKEYKDYS